MDKHEVKDGCIPGISALRHTGEKDGTLEPFNLIISNGSQQFDLVFESNSDFRIY